MSTRLLGGDTAAGIVGKQCVEEIQSVSFEVVDEIFVVVTCPFGEGGLEVGKARDAGPDLLVRGAEGSAVMIRDDDAK
jgi:hypothetical protein